MDLSASELYLFCQVLPPMMPGREVSDIYDFQTLKVASIEYKRKLQPPYPPPFHTHRPHHHVRYVAFSSLTALQSFIRVLSWTEFQSLHCSPPPGIMFFTSSSRHSLKLYFGFISPFFSGHLHVHDHGYPGHLGVWRVMWFTVSRCDRHSR